MLKDNNKEDQDILNIKIIELDICAWNLLHVLFYFLICKLFNVKTIQEYVSVFLLGIAWFFFERKMFSNYNKNIPTEKKDYVYASISYPRYDDILFNLFGIVLYYITRK
jgi:hypothetical protein